MSSVHEIPALPAFADFTIERTWDDAAPSRPKHRALVRLGAGSDGLHVEASMPHQQPARIPDAPPGARVDGLWEYDVVEVFLVGADGRYVELELGAGGHQLLLGFTAPRVPDPAFPERSLAIDWQSDAAGWNSRCTLSRAWLPEPLVAANAFAVGGGCLLAHCPTGGHRADFHRPETYPAIRIPSWA